MPDGVVPAQAVDDALANLADQKQLTELLEPFSPDELADLIERLNPLIDGLEYIAPPPGEEVPPADPAFAATAVLLNQLPRLVEDRGPQRFRGSMILMRAVQRLLQRLPDQEVRNAAMKAAFDHTVPVSGRLVLLMVTRRQREAEAGLVSAETCVELETRLREQIAILSPEQFAALDRAAWAADYLSETEAGQTALQALADDNQVLAAVLAGHVGRTRTQEWGAAAVSVTETLDWSGLVGWFGEDFLVRRVTELAEAAAKQEVQLSDAQAQALLLATDCAAGNRPSTPWDRLAPKVQPAASEDANEDATETEQD